MDIEGQIKFSGATLNVYDSVNEPWFSIKEIEDILHEDTAKLIRRCEADEVKDGFVNEMGLMNILAGSRRALARAWRRVVFKELIRIRRELGQDIIDKFEEWDLLSHGIYFDEETGILMESYTVQGGDVEQRPFNPDSYFKEEKQ